MSGPMTCDVGRKYSQLVSSLDSPEYFQTWGTEQRARRTTARGLREASRENKTARDECNER